LRDEEDKIEQAGLQVLLVGMGTMEESEEFRKEMKIQFPLVCDEERNLYKIFSLKRASLLNMASPALIFKGLKTMAEGYKLMKPKHDAMQLPGVFIIDTSGIIRWSHYANDAADNPSVDTIIKSIKDMMP